MFITVSSSPLSYQVTLRLAQPTYKIRIPCTPKPKVNYATQTRSLSSVCRDRSVKQRQVSDFAQSSVRLLKNTLGFVFAVAVVFLAYSIVNILQNTMKAQCGIELDPENIRSKLARNTEAYRRRATNSSKGLPDAFYMQASQYSYHMS